MRRLWPIFIIYIIGISIIGGAVSAVSFYTWSGSLEVGQSVYVNGLALTVDKDNNTGKLALIIRGENAHGLLEDGQKGTFEGLEIIFNAMNGYGVVSISSEKPFTLSFTKDYAEKLNQLEQENAELKAQNANLSQQISSLEAQVQKLQEENEKLKKQEQSAANAEQLNARIVELEKENRKLKAELANLTNKYNAVLAKANFLEQQNEEYKTMIQSLLKDTAQGSEREYVKQAEKKELIGSVLWKSFIVSLVVVGLIGYGLYRKKRSWEYGGL